MKTLVELLTTVPGVREITGNTAVSIKNLCFDSRRIESGDCFFAIQGVQSDGHQFIDKAIEKGAIAIICDRQETRVTNPAVTCVVVEDSAVALGFMASAWFDHPSRALQVVGVTGTNGKTTVTTLLYELFTVLGEKAGLIGTVENRIAGQILPSNYTTPDAVALQQLLRQMADAGCTRVFIEASSHAIVQHRITGIILAGAVFTNLTHEHLDYHQTFAAYRDAKKLLFDSLPGTAFALTNADDKNGRFMLQNTAAAQQTYGLKSPATFKAKILEDSLAGLQMQLDQETIHARLIGTFNAYNLTAVYGTARLLGVDKMEALTAISNLRGAEGRFEAVPNPHQPGSLAIVDYAHTPDALENVLETIVKLKKSGSRVITVVGCGGDRDKTKRPKMARIGARYSDQLVLTSDNPRTEDPARILQEMEAGLDKEMLQKTLVIENREQAIKTACRLAGPADVILVAGKGHEKYQEIQGIKYPFDDKKMLLEYFE
ncbi:MAG: UDP-N-acetylmuramoyl-L-alanyl-D-glutamate--2,6-diaminopimelate ligase [Bacteroidetes bacterium]|nr:MAG: UDP-N-acetylmuramoyl-L-alanyl-D-glutamate--2,6-diaminopimelate ligase [Bacteroidota bacterium]